MTDFKPDLVVGKTVKDARHIYEDRASDKLVLVFTDGSSVVVEAWWGNDDTAGLGFEHAP